jgi:small subunit ribosomal protein S20
LANTKSAKKRVRQNDSRRLRNRIHGGAARTRVKQARIDLESGDPAAAAESIRAAVKALDHAASKGSIHKRNAARRKSRLMKQLAQLEAQAK